MSFEQELVASQDTRLPQDFEEFWQRRASVALGQRGDNNRTDAVLVEAGIASPVAVYEELRYAGADGTPLKARCVRPRNIAGPVPVVFSFYDDGRAPRGWHRLTRWVALGYAVVQPERRFWSGDITEGWQRGAGGLTLGRLVEDAALCISCVHELPFADEERLMVYGEGLGAGIALGAMAMAGMAGFDVRNACLLNPLPADFRATWQRSGCEGTYAGLRWHFRNDDPTGKKAEELFAVLDYVDGVNFARCVEARVLLGTSLMDTMALPATQSEVYNALPGHKERVVYPKWGHERVNDFEDKTLGWLRPLSD